jgi:galactokinase
LAKGLKEAGVDGERGAAALFVPGRIELLGKHTDYAGGRSLVTATPQGLSVLVAPREDSELSWHDLTRGVEARFDAAHPGERPGHWSNYLRTPARRAVLNFGPPQRGLDAAMTSDLPAAAGLSSSSALVVAAFLALDAANDLSATPEYRAEIRDESDRAGYLGAVENGLAFKGLSGSYGVGTFGGSEDHAAILGSRSGRLRQYGFTPLRLEREIALPAGWALVVATSGVRAKKTGTAQERYNRLATLAGEGAAAWRRATQGDEQHLGSALAAAGSAERLLGEVQAGLANVSSAGEIFDRVAHFAEESGRLVPDAAAAFAAGDGARLGRVVDRSQRLAEELLRNQVPETRSLARLARDAGALAASAFGGGFGGAVWAVVERESSSDFAASWREAYVAAFPDAARGSRFFASAPGPGAYWAAIDSTMPGGDDLGGERA